MGSSAMRLRHGVILGLGITALAAAPGFAQSNGQSRGKPPVTNLISPTSPVSPAGAAVRNLAEALAASYANNPALQAERAKLRATDEGVPQALAGWKPQVSLSGTAGYGDGNSWQYLPSGRGGVTLSSKTDRLIATAGAGVTQPLYRGGHTRASTNRAENQVMAERARLIAQEEQTFTDTVTAYVGLIQTQQILSLSINNEQVLARQLQATNDRFRVGEITRTDVAQAEAALAGATAGREAAAGNVQIARSSFVRAIGVPPPGNLVEPQPLKLPVKNQIEAANMAILNNPTVVAAMFDDAAAKDQVDVAFSALMPQLSLQGQVFQQQNSNSAHSVVNGYQIVAGLTVPLYQGGSEYSAVRQARQTQQQSHKLVDDARRNAVQQAVQAWETLATTHATVQSTQVQIRANEVALEGVQREAIVGSRTTLDVLNAQQALLSSEVTLVTSLATLVNNSYAVANAIGRLTAQDLNLSVPLYDDTAYYNIVRNKWAGTGDYAIDQPGR